MTTSFSLLPCLSLIDKAQIEQFYSDTTTDHYVLSVAIFNTGMVVTLEPFYYGVDNEEEIGYNSFIIDFDQLTQLYKDEGVDIYDLID